MTESTTPSKFTKWKRALIGGFLSAVIALAGYILGLSNDSFWFLIGSRFAGLPGLFYGNPLDLIFRSEDSGITLISAFWFLTGALIAYFIRKNSLAVVCWLLLLFISGFFAV